MLPAADEPVRDLETGGGHSLKIDIPPFDQAERSHSSWFCFISGWYAVRHLLINKRGLGEIVNQKESGKAVGGAG
jgi:hypothetical protein